MSSELAGTDNKLGMFPADDKQKIQGISNPYFGKRRQWLPGRDSNPDKQNQNLSCYRYTTGQDGRWIQYATLRCDKLKRGGDRFHERGKVVEMQVVACGGDRVNGGLWKILKDDGIITVAHEVGVLPLQEQSRPGVRESLRHGVAAQSGQ